MTVPGTVPPRGRRPAGRIALIARRAAVLVVSLGALSLAACEPLSGGEFGREVDTIVSIASEGAVLADQVAGQRTKRTFARVQARELSGQAQHSAERLEDAHPEPQLEGPTTEARDIASAVADALGAIEVAPDDSTAATDIAAELRDLAARAKELSE